MCLLNAISLILIVQPITGRVAPQGEEMEVKAAFIYNFTLLTTWPQNQADIHICVIGDEGMGEALRAYEGRRANNATIKVRKLRVIDDARPCDVMMIEKSAAVHGDDIHKAIDGQPTLTITDANGADASSMMIRLIRENNRIAFEINQQAASNAGISFSYKLLKLARKVQGGAP